jgi:hypothetical protein
MSAAPAEKHDQDKARLDLLPWTELLEVVRVLEFGAKKYAPEAWRRVPDARRRYLSAALRHLAAISMGETVDPESGLLHAAHAACCALFLIRFAGTAVATEVP